MWMNPVEWCENSNGESKMISPGMYFVVRPPHITLRQIINNIAEDTGIPDAPLEAEIAQKSSQTTKEKKYSQSPFPI